MIQQVISEWINTLEIININNANVAKKFVYYNKIVYKFLEILVYNLMYFTNVIFKYE